MARSLILLLVASCALGAPPQDDPVETRSYDAAVLTSGVPDFIGDPVGISYEAIGTAVAAGEELRTPLSEDALLSLLRENLAEASWQDPAMKIRFADGTLSVTQRKSVHERIGQALRSWRALFGRRISIEAAFVSVDPQVLARIRAAGDPDRPGVLSPEQRRTLLAQAELQKSMRLVARPGQRVSLQELEKRSYVADHDVQIATSEGTLDPIVDVLATGPSVDVRPWLEPFEGGVTLELRLDAVEFEGLDDRKVRISKEIFPATVPEAPKPPATFMPLDRLIQLPRVQHDRIRTNVTLRDRETAVAGSVLRKNRAVLFLITPGILPAEEKPAEIPAELRAFDVSALGRGIQSWTGPSLDVASPQRGGGGPLTGARFTLDKPSVHLVTPLDDLIRARITPSPWKEGESPLVFRDQAMLVPRRPEIVRDVEKALADIARTHAATFTTETIVIGFRGGARAEWEKEIPALAPGASSADAASIDTLLEEASRGRKVRVVERSEITSCPGQRVHVLRSRQQAYLQDYEPQVSTNVSVMDPIVGRFVTGFLMDVCARSLGDGVAVELRAELSSGEMKEADVFAGRAGAVQTPHAKILKWNATVRCARGAYSLVALQSTGAGEEAEELAVFLRSRPNVFK